MEKDGVTVHPAYAQYSFYEDKLDKRPAAVKRDWWKDIFTQLEARGSVETVIMNERLARYTQPARSTEARKNYGDRRRAGAPKKASVATAVLGAEEGFSQVVDDCAEYLQNLLQQQEELLQKVPVREKKRAARAVASIGNIPPNESEDIKSAKRDVVGKKDDYSSSRAGDRGSG